MDAAQQTLASFADDIVGFLDALSGVFPECEAVQRIKRDAAFTIGASSASVRDAARKMLITSYHERVSPFYERCRAKDGRVFTDCQEAFLSDLKIADKYAEVQDDADTREAIWAWIARLNASAEMYDLFRLIPPTLCAQMTNAASGVAEGGSIDPARMQQQIAQLVTSVDQEELKKFSEAMLARPGGVGGLLQMVGRLQGGAGGAAGAGDLLSMVASLGGGV